MSKYVDKPHGLTIGSDNWFFITGDGDLRDGYKAIVSVRGYDYDQIDTMNCGIWTPAQQLLWETIHYTENHEYQGHSWQTDKQAYVLRPWWRNWLNTNVGEEREKWDVRSRYDDRRGPIFFRGRNSAVAFVKQVDTRLKGIKIGEW